MKTTNLRKIIFVCIIFILACFSSNICLALEINPKSIDLGDIPIGVTIIKKITIKNNEEQTVILEQARSSCDCVKIEYKKDTLIDSGKDYTISLIIDTTDLPEGKTKKFIFLSFNDLNEPIFSITVSGNIISP
ncbi:MAG: DUF1573 domain-containing protein [Candidatus Omnitrophica bacterium]|nr:DUF1573 domain-containing protein [Candidatus Omnitrophota bacterium]